jgi:pyruvoyl-dependent arginine decarboxylase (PvlArgDC)
MLPTRFWLTTGKGESDVSELNAIDSAFLDAGLGYQNHVAVSSIPPEKEIIPKIDHKKGITFVPVKDEFILLPISSVIYVVRSMNTGKIGEEIACSIALAKVELKIEQEPSKCVLAFETQGSSLIDVERNALAGVKKMVKIRKANLQDDWGNSGYKIISSSLEIKEKFGCVIAFVVFDPFTYEEV